MSVTAYDAINDALEQGAEVGFEMKPGFTTHWPMGSDALIELGHPELVHDWVEQFLIRHKHFDRPAPVRPIDLDDEAESRAALGDFDRVGDWLVAFERELAERPWPEVLVAWWPRLLFGCSAGLTHSLIRTMHAVRSLDRSGDDFTEAQLGELAMALAYWAGRYVEQPADKELHGQRSLREVLEALPRLDAEVKIGLRDKGFFLHMPDIAGWSQEVEELAQPLDVDEAFSELTLTFVQAQLAHPELFPIPQVHATTAPAAMRVMLKYLPQELHVPSFVAVYYSCAALTATFLQPNAEELRTTPNEALHIPESPERLVEDAVEHADMHSIKVTEACLREYATRPDARYLQLPQRIIDTLPPFFRGSHPRANQAA
jgi:hypothetical protein